MKIFSGTSHRDLATNIAQNLGLSLGQAFVGQFSDGEVRVEFQESVRGVDVVLIQSTCYPHAEYLMELLALADAAQRACARSITAVFPYFGYARQDRRAHNRRTPILAKVVANALSQVGIDRLITLDLHTDQIPGFFANPVEHLHATNLIVHDIQKQALNRLKVASPDIGGVVRAQAVSEGLGESELIVLNKVRNRDNTIDRVDVIGSVQGCDCVIIDDLVDTGSTIIQAAIALKKAGAALVFAYATHGVFSKKEVFLLDQDDVLDGLIVTDTIPSDFHHAKLRILPADKLIAQAILCNQEGGAR